MKGCWMRDLEDDMIIWREIASNKGCQAVIWISRFIWNIYYSKLILSMIKTSFIFFLIVSLAFSLTIDSPTFISLIDGSYSFQVSGGKAPYKFDVSGMPKGIILDNSRLNQQEAVASGQYILGIKATDSSGESQEKIIILNIDPSSGNIQFNKNTQSQSSEKTVIMNSYSAQSSQSSSAKTPTISIKESNTDFPSIQMNKIIPNGNSKMAVNTQKTSSNVVSGSSIQSKGKTDESFNVDSLKSLFGDSPSAASTTSTMSASSPSVSSTFTSTSTSTSSSLNKNTNNRPDTLSQDSNNVNLADFGGTINLSAPNFNVNTLNSFFNQINVDKKGQTDTLNHRTSIKTSLNDILSDFSTTEVTSNQTNQIQINAENINSNIQTKSYKFDLKDTDIVDDQQAFKLFEAQKVAANFVATNFSMVQQITANKKTIYDLLMTISTTYQSLTESYKITLTDLNIATSNKSKIESAISNLNTYLGSITSQIDTSNSKRLELNSQRSTLLNQNNQSDLQANQIRQNIQLLNQQLLIVSNSLNNNENSCTRVNNNLLETDKNISISNSQLGLISQQFITTSQDVISKKAIVDDLTKRLALAQRQLTEAQSAANNLNKQKSDIEQRIASMNQNVIVLRLNQNECNSQLTTIRQNIVTINSNIQSNTTALRRHGGTKEDKGNQIALLQNQINQEVSRRDQLIVEKQNAGNALIVLQNALPNASNTLNILVSKKSHFQLNLQSQQRNLKETVTKFKEYEKKLQIATMDLQNARAISQQADQQVNNMLARKKNILPYAIGVQSTNNALIGQTIVNPTINISNWFNFLSANFGSNLVQYSNQDIDCLYPFNLISSLQNNIQCPAETAPLYCLSGKIVSIKNSYELMIKADDSGATIQLQIPSCASLYSNTLGYKMKAGDSVIVKGVSLGNNVTVAKRVICLNAE